MLSYAFGGLPILLAFFVSIIALVVLDGLHQRSQSLKTELEDAKQRNRRLQAIVNRRYYGQNSIKSFEAMSPVQTIHDMTSHFSRVIRSSKTIEQYLIIMNLLPKLSKKLGVVIVSLSQG